MIAFAVFIVAVFAAALLGARFCPDAWYDELAKPSWQPPNRVFAPVWTVLYVAIAVAGWRLWTVGSGLGVTFWAIQLALNAIWSPLFFGAKRIDLALVDIVALWVAIVATAVVAASVDGVATALLVPYLAWVSFATALNFAVWRLNRARI
jgi:tryptophan-rich sensory protein